MATYFKHIDRFNLRTYLGFGGVVYIGIDKNDDNHIFGISDIGFTFTFSRLADTFKILDEPDEMDDYYV